MMTWNITVVNDPVLTTNIEKQIFILRIGAAKKIHLPVQAELVLVRVTLNAQLMIASTSPSAFSTTANSAKL